MGSPSHAVRLQGVPFPRGLEAEHERRLVARFARVQAALEKRIGPALEAVSAQLDEAARLDASPGAAIIRVIDAVAVATGRIGTPTSALLGVARRLDLSASRSVSGLARVPLARKPSESALHRRWVAESVDLIKTVDARYFEGLRKGVLEAVERGRPTSELRQLIQRRGGIARRQAALIARDQIGKLNGQITQLRQTELGVDAYFWTTAGDDRVREEHAARDGQRFRWDRPPDDGHPGEPIGCRCVAYPDLGR